MTYRYSSLVAAAVLAVVVGIGPAAHAADAPAIALNQSGYAKQQMTITAGPSGLPDGFAVWWMDADAWYANSQTWPEYSAPGMGWAKFTGVPTLNTFGGQYTTFRLGPNESIMIEIGDLADESGVVGMGEELQYGKEYYFCAFALDETGAKSSALSVTIEGVTLQSNNCTYTQGYWKNHKDNWPVLSLTLGTVVYTQQELCDILDQPVQGNGLVSLAHQLIATKLNLANGADPTDVIAAVNDADALIGGLVIPPVGGGYLDPSATSATTQVLDDFNNGIIGPGHCDGVPVEERSWGGLKSIYR